MSSRKRRVNPNRRPATVADVNKAKRQAESYAITAVWAIFFRTMSDKYGWKTVRLQRLWNYCNDLAESVSSGQVTVDEIVQSLADEDGIVLK